jgi:hypothetical protein
MAAPRKGSYRSELNSYEGHRMGPLGNGEVWTGEPENTLPFSTLVVTVSANGGVGGTLEVQFSAWDDSRADWHTSDTYTIESGAYRTLTFQPVDRYIRLKWTNGAGSSGTHFHISTTFKDRAIKSSSHPLEEDLSGQNDAELVKAIVAGKLPNGEYGNVDITASKGLQVVITDENQDAFGRVRVSDPITLHDSTFAYGLEPRVYEDISSGNGSVTYNSNSRCAELAVTAGAPGVAGLQSYQYCHYNPGKSHVLFMTLAANPNVLTMAAGQKVEVGYFDDANGLFARYDSTGVYAVRRSSVTGSVVEEAVHSSNFNLDPLDGTGPSGVLLDPNVSQIVVIDLQFLGVGRVRMGLEVAGRIIYAHQFNFANENPGMYMQSGTLPVRWRFEDTGTTGWDHTEAYCSMVSTEGGAEENRGIPLVARNVAGISVASGADTHLISIRPKTTFAGLPNRIWNILEEVSALNSGNNDVLVTVYYDATITGGAWADVDTSDSGMEQNVTASFAPGTGVAIGDFWVTSTATNPGQGALSTKNRLPIAINAAGTTPVGTITLVARGLGGTSTSYGSIHWREVR